MNPKPDPEFERVLKENLEYEKMSRSERAVWWAELPKRREREAQAADLAYQKKYPTCAQGDDLHRDVLWCCDIHRHRASASGRFFDPRQLDHVSVLVSNAHVISKPLTTTIMPAASL
jgi:hypothetical protein